MRFSIVAFFFIYLAIPLFSLNPEAKTGFVLKKGDVVAFVGGTDMVRMQKEGRVEAALTHRYKKARPRFRDLSWDCLLYTSDAADE